MKLTVVRRALGPERKSRHERLMAIASTAVFVKESSQKLGRSSLDGTADIPVQLDNDAETFGGCRFSAVHKRQTSLDV